MIGIIGAGGIGQAFASRLASVKIDAMISNSRGPDSLAELVQDLGPGIIAVTVEEAARAGIVFVAVPWNRLSVALSGLPAWNSRIVIDSTNPLNPPDFKIADLHGQTSSEVVADLVQGARLVKAFNTLTPAVLRADPREAGGRRVIFLSGDDVEAKFEVERLVDRMGFFPIDLGGLAACGRLQQFPGGPFPTLNLLNLP